MEADLLRYYHVDLDDLWTGRMTIRKFSVLVKHLPRDSATTSALDETARWTIEAVLLADLYHAWTGEVHPALPTKQVKAHRHRDLAAKLQEQKARLAAQKEAS